MLKIERHANEIQWRFQILPAVEAIFFFFIQHNIKVWKDIVTFRVVDIKRELKLSLCY